MTGHVGAHAHPHGRRAAQMKVRVEIGDAVNAMKRSLGAVGKRLQLFLRQVAVLRLDLPEIVKNQQSSPWVTKRASAGLPKNRSGIVRSHYIRNIGDSHLLI